MQRSSTSATRMQEGLGGVAGQAADQQTGPERAILVGLITPQQNEFRTTEYLDELEFLAATAGAETVKRFTQKVNGPNSTTYLGTGKLKEIHQYIEEEEEAERHIDIVFFDD